MAADYKDLFLEQGSTFKKTLTLKDDSGIPYNLSIYNTIKSQARRTHLASNTIIDFTCTIINASNGIIELSANSAVTANISNRKLVYDIIIANTSTNEIIRTSEGQIIVDFSVTR